MKEGLPGEARKQWWEAGKGERGSEVPATAWFCKGLWSINYISRFVQLQGKGVGLLYTCASQSLAVGSFVGQGRGSCNAHGGRHSISSRARKTWGDGDTKCQWKWYEGFWCRTNIVHLGRENNFKGTFLDILMEVLCTPKYCCDIPLLSYSPEEGTVPSKSVTS